MSWAAQRRLFYVLGSLCIFAALISFPVYSFLQTPPTCFDGIHNGLETDVDKGGECRLLDSRSLIPLSVQWVRPFETQEGIYNAVAYIENPNEQAGIMSLKYELRLYDAKNTPVAIREGTTYVMPGSITPLFEGRIDSGKRIVTRAFLDIVEEPRWERMTDVARAVAIENKQAQEVTVSPRVTAVAHNTAVRPITTPSFVAVVFDTAGNAFAGSQTTFERLDAGEKRDLVFTWNKTWPLVVGRIDVLPRAEPRYEEEKKKTQ
jgi:hypothetical protein